MVEETAHPSEGRPETPPGGGAEAPPSGAAEETSLQDLLDERQRALDQLKDKYLRALAEFDNYKKRVVRDRADWIKYANEKVFLDLLPVVDHLEMALRHVPEEGTSAGLRALTEGVELTLKQFKDVLAKFGVSEVTPLGGAFDPAWHEAIGQVESEEHPSLTVVEEVQKGYCLHDRALRPAKVIVSKQPEQGSQES
ncbi:MAG: nucleotide exchange factor GrpE [Nitrospirae bacterium]|nr:nucleotide exchange factor GrpE [Nitrospirota bacterium]